MRLLPCGDTGLLVELDDLEQVLALHAHLQHRPPPGVLELVPAARTLLVRVQPGADLAAVARAVRGEAAAPPPAPPRAEDEVVIPVVYDGEDLAEVAAHVDASVDEVVALHTGQVWTVAFTGFAPGFGYLVGTQPGLHVPRRPSPRTRVPAGAVALAGEFTGVYPRASPGGWRVIGRTRVTVWDLEREPPALLRPGTRVRFEVAR